MTAVIRGRKTADNRRRFRSLSYRSKDQRVLEILEMVAGLHGDATHAEGTCCATRARTAARATSFRFPKHDVGSVLAFVRSASRLRHQSNTRTSSRMDRIQSCRRQRSGCRHLARDLSGPRGRVRNSLSGHAPLGARQRNDACRSGRSKAFGERTLGIVAGRRSSTMRRSNYGLKLCCRHNNI